MLAAHADLAHKLAELERKYDSHRGVGLESLSFISRYIQ